MNNDDFAIQRAAGVIMQHMMRGKSAEEAIARAEKREPQLTPTDIREAYKWARAAIRFAELCQDAAPETTIGELLDKAGVPWGA